MSSDVVPPILNIWNPIEALRAPNASVTVVFIAPHAVAYEKRVVDPVFQATNSSRNSFSKLWMPDYVFRIVGCVDQRGDWSGPFVNNGISKQFATITRLEEYARNLTIWSSIRSLGSGALIAHSLVPEHTYKAPGLPPNQWQLEARRWFETGLAKLQYKVVQYTNMDFVKPFADIPLQQPEIVDSNFGNTTELNEMLQSQCESQLVKLNGRGQNVSVLGLVIILVLAAALMTFSLALQWWAGRYPPRGEKRRRWQQEQLLELWQAAQGVNKK
ncbi:hypothetical protein HG530_007870 [Fusarium avenaceum]|nr:hypothetical protein HG530_007870 [Fusarium avenaceum]